MMKIFKGVLLIVLIIICLFHESSLHQVELHDIVAAVNKIAFYSGTPKSCDNDIECLHTEKCISAKCINPCQVYCGINALCYVRNYTVHCECPLCYSGNAEIKCEKYKGLRYWSCVIIGTC